MELSSFFEIYLNYWTEFKAIRSFYSIVLKIKISMLVFNAIKFTYLLLDKTFPVKK
jgi:hypothetical protein